MRTSGFGLLLVLLVALFGLRLVVFTVNEWEQVVVTDTVCDIDPVLPGGASVRRHGDVDVAEERVVGKVPIGVDEAFIDDIDDVIGRAETNRRMADVVCEQSSTRDIG